MKIYTKNGDQGNTTLYDGTGMPKSNPYFDFLGTVDELTSAIGVARAHIQEPDLVEGLHNQQKILIQLMGEVAKYPAAKGYLQSEHVTALEHDIDAYTRKMPKNKEFICPGNYPASAHLHLARTICRRAERSLYSVEEQGATISEYIKKFMNRLSDYLFTLARYMDFVSDIEALVKGQMKTIAPTGLSHPKTLDLKKSVALIEKVEKEAAKMGLSVVIAIANEAGHTIAVHSMDGALLASFELATNKAFTSVAVKMSTEDLGKASAPGQSLYGIQFSHGGRIVNFGGGIPLYEGEAIIGAIGVSGGSAEEDVALAKFGVKALGELIKS